MAFGFAGAGGAAVDERRKQIADQVAQQELALRQNALLSQIENNRESRDLQGRQVGLAEQTHADEQARLTAGDEAYAALMARPDVPQSVKDMLMTNYRLKGNVQSTTQMLDPDTLQQRALEQARAADEGQIKVAEMNNAGQDARQTRQIQSNEKIAGINAAGRLAGQRSGSGGGRGVTSGDANRMAELESSLRDIDTLEHEIGKTGTLSALGAWVPKSVTDLTGFGTDAKQRQATIDRVKQVIGKALEGGVLRREDEYKYTKILPTIGDTPDVAKTKIANLRAALENRRSIQMDALEDAGYDVSAYRARAPRATAGGGSAGSPDLSGLKPGTGRTFTSGPFQGQTWTVDASGSPKRVR